eukprot:2780327-Pleurochrysis_carterae.AAC.1
MQLALEGEELLRRAVGIMCEAAQVAGARHHLSREESVGSNQPGIGKYLVEASSIESLEILDAANNLNGG